MIAPDSAAGLRAEQRFDLVAAVLIGLIALLAAILSVVQMQASQTANRADLQAARLEADLSARISVSSGATDAGLSAQQIAIMLGLDAIARQEAGLQHNDPTSMALGAAEQSAYDKLSAVLAETSNTTGGKPVDAYTAGLLHASIKDMQTEVSEESHQVDLSDAARRHEQLAVLGLSFLALAGVLTGLAAVLREGRSGRISLSAACGMAAAAGLLAILAFI
jgi:hypothetical protein